MFVFSYMMCVAWGSEYTISTAEDPSELIANLQPGDTLLFQAGTYNLAETWTWTIAGTASEPITLRAEEGAEFVLSHSASPGIVLQESDWVNLDGFVIHGDDSWAANSNIGIFVQDSEDIALSEHSA